MNPKKVIGIGELLWDVLPAGKRIGGAPVNFTHYVNQSGCEGYAVSAIGSDASGDELLAKFVSLGLNAGYVQRNAFPTGSVGVTLDDKGVPTYDIYENVAWDNIATDEATLALASRADAVCWGSLAQRSGVSRRTILAIVDAVRSDALKVFDINLRQNYYDEPTLAASLERATVLKLNDDELKVLAPFYSLSGDDEAQLRQLLERFSLQYVVYTMGAVGSLILGADGSRSYVATPKVAVADTVGAGDSFTATFVSMLLQGHPLAEAHRRAVDVAAYVCTCNGAIAPLAAMKA